MKYSSPIYEREELKAEDVITTSPQQDISASGDGSASGSSSAGSWLDLAAAN